MYKTIKRCLAALLAIMLIVSLSAFTVNAESPDTFSAKTDIDTGKADIYFSFSSLAGEDVSVAVLDPNFAFDEEHPENWVNNYADNPVYFTQITLDNTGAGSFSFIPNEDILYGKYKVVFGTDNGVFYNTFAYNIPEIVNPSVGADKDYYQTGEKINLTIFTDMDIVKVGIANENGKFISKSKEVSSEYYGYKKWDVVISVGTKGNRTFELYTMAAGQSLNATGKTVSVKITAKYDAPISDDAVEIRSVAPSSNEYAVKTPITFTVKTSTSVAKLGIFNENGKGIVSSSSYIDSGIVRTWTVTFSVSTKGYRKFTVKAAGPDFVWADSQTTDYITIK